MGGDYMVKKLCMAFGFFLLPDKCYANSGIPMIAIVWPIFWAAFIPIVLIEWLVLRKMLKHFSSGFLLYVTFVANGFSTLIGIPLAWLGLCLLELSEFLIMLILGISIGIISYTINKFNISSLILMISDGKFPLIISAIFTAPWLIPYESDLYWMIPFAFMVLLVPFFYVSYRVESYITMRYIPNQNELVKKSVWVANLCSYLMLFILSFGYLIYELIKHKKLPWLSSVLEWF